MVCQRVLSVITMLILVYIVGLMNMVAGRFLMQSLMMNQIE
jgi:hypothetical protein